ncbi:ABC transporter permease [Schaalia vaccimaxillae]|uniref:ABC transporter permease n=1 Tax=Schaalia vaccimaxillae TaxID=183916 RepID=UPI0003B6D4A4|nr:ABC transporter permease [Schaalia vaccimaxillae]
MTTPNVVNDPSQHANLGVPRQTFGRPSRKVGSGWKGLPTLTWWNFWKLITNPFSLGFSIALPIFMYLMFGTDATFADTNIGHANVSAAILVNMAIYGVIMTSSSMGANVSLERVSGVSRLYALTPMLSSALIVARLLASILISAVVLALVYTIGATTGATMEPAAWIGSALIILVATMMPTALGLAAGYLVRSDGVFALTSIITVVCSFMSGMFMPLEQMGEFFSAVAPWTPFYGMMKLAQVPLIGWDSFEWQWAATWLGWAVFFAGVAVWAQRRDTGR